MDPELKAKLDQALQSKQRADAAKLAEDDARRKRILDTISEFKVILEDVVRPALIEVMQYIKANGVDGSIEETKSSSDYKEKIQCPSLRLRVGREAYIAAEIEAPTAFVLFPYSSIANGSGTRSSYNRIRMAELTKEKVQEYAVNLVTEVLKSRS